MAGKSDKRIQEARMELKGTEECVRRVSRVTGLPEGRIRRELLQQSMLCAVGPKQHPTSSRAFTCKVRVKSMRVLNEMKNSSI